MSQPVIDATMVYDFFQCPHRVVMDLHGEPSRRDDVSSFVQLLWRKGATHKKEVIAQLDCLDLSDLSVSEREKETLAAMERGEELIFGGRLQVNGLVGEPDLLRLSGGGYVAGEIKGGSGEDSTTGNLKKDYGVQLAVHTDILQQLGFAASRTPFVLDIDGQEVAYDLDASQGTRKPWTIWGIYIYTLTELKKTLQQPKESLAAYSATCKQCHWYSACLEDLEAADDLTLLAELGRSKRDVMRSHIASVSEFAATDPQQFHVDDKKTVFPGIGVKSLAQFHARAQLQKATNPQPYLIQPLQFLEEDREIFFDIEVDPMRNHCYLHGFVERLGGDIETETYTGFFAEGLGEEPEKQAFADAWRYLRDHQPCAIYYYSKYERTIWRQLQARYPSICSSDEVEALFSKAYSMDLYFDAVKKASEWPTYDRSIKTLARYLGFEWKDTHPSGAASIEWFDRWLTTGDESWKQRILIYNEDDCVATRVILDGLKQLPILQP